MAGFDVKRTIGAWKGKMVCAGKNDRLLQIARRCQLQKEQMAKN